jgi:hypothetical protein
MRLLFQLQAAWKTRRGILPFSIVIYHIYIYLPHIYNIYIYIYIYTHTYIYIYIYIPYRFFACLQYRLLAACLLFRPQKPPCAHSKCGEASNFRHWPRAGFTRPPLRPFQSPNPRPSPNPPFLLSLPPSNSTHRCTHRCFGKLMFFRI